MTTETLDGNPSLRDRVQSLRLPQRVDTGQTSRGGWLPWALTLLLAFAVGQLVGWMYLATNTAPDYARSFVSSLVVLPVIVSLLMMLMSGSLMIAFGLLAVFAVVRFRNVLRDTRDTVFILWTIVEGMSVGTMRYSTAVLGAAVISAVLAYLRISNFGSRRMPDGIKFPEPHI